MKRSGSQEPSNETERLMQRVAELEKRNRLLEELAATDELTGLPNRRTLETRLKQEAANCIRHGRSFSLLFIDVDCFKQINDADGHLAGDAVLRQISDTLRAKCRSTDIVARWGGEEFAIVLTDTESQGAVEAAERIRKSVELMPSPYGAVTISVGAATFPADTSDLESLLAVADERLYRAKLLGRNRVVRL